MKSQNESSNRIFTQMWSLALCASLCTALWGSATPVIKIGYEFFQIQAEDMGSKLLFAGVRFCFAGLLTWGLMAVKQKKWTMPKREDLAPIATLGVIQTTLQCVFFYIGLTYTTGAKASLFSSISGFMVIMAAPLFNRDERLTGQKVIGSVLAVVGLIFTNMDGGLGELAGFKVMGEGLVLLSAVCNAVSFFYIKRYTRTRDPKLLTGYQLLFGGALLVVVGMATGGRLVFNSWQCVLSMAYLIIMSTVANNLWTILLTHNPVSRVSVFHMLTPLFGTALSGLILREHVVTVPNFIALVLVCSGVWLVNAQRAKKATVAEAGGQA